MALKNNDLVNQESKKFMEKMMAALQENDAEGAANATLGISNIVRRNIKYLFFIIYSSYLVIFIFPSI